MIIYYKLLQKPSNTAVITVKRVFNKIFGKYLYITNTITCGVLMAGGDVIQQHIEIYKVNAKNEYNWHRTGRMFIVGLAQGPPQHIFYRLLDWFLPKRDLKSITKKIILDQLIASPVCIIIFFFGMGFLEGCDYTSVMSEFKRKFITVYAVSILGILVGYIGMLILVW